jgi:hypothetical protein
MLKPLGYPTQKPWIIFGIYILFRPCARKPSTADKRFFLLSFLFFCPKEISITTDWGFVLEKINQSKC